MGGVEPPLDGPMSHFLEFSLHKIHHLPGFGEVVLELAFFIAVATIGSAFGAILFGAPFAGILVHRHAAALAKTVETSHD